MHFHFYYLSNDLASITAANAFINKTTQAFDLNIDVCADNNGHEQPHNATCWLSGPGGGGPLAPASTDGHIGGSFALPDYSLYVVRKDFLRVMSYTLTMKNAAENGLDGDIDFLVHPNSGCSYADHVFWGLHASTYVPANRQGVAEEADWFEAYAPSVDPWSVAYPGNEGYQPISGYYHIWTYVL